MLRIQSPSDQQSFLNENLISQSERGSVAENSYYISTPSKTNKKPNTKSAHQSKTNLSTGNQSTSMLKQVMRKDQELDELRTHNHKLQEKYCTIPLTQRVRDVEYLLNKAAEEIRRKNEDHQQLELQINRVTMELHQQKSLMNQLQYEQQLQHIANDPNLQQMWERGAFLEQENESLKSQLNAVEHELLAKLEILGQSHQYVEATQTETIKLQEELKTKAKQLKKLKQKNKVLKEEAKSHQESDRVVAALKQEIENQREDIKELLKEKIEQERHLKRISSQTTNETHKSEHQEVQLLRLQYLSQQQQMQAEVDQQKSITSKLEMELDSREKQVKLLENELERHQQLLIDTEQHYQGQIESLRRVDQTLAVSQSLKHDLTYSRSSKQQYGVPSLNFRGSIEEAEHFLNEERGKVYSSRINTHRQQRRHVEQYSLTGCQLQEELQKSLERESHIDQELEKLCTQFLTQTKDKLSQSRSQASNLAINLEELSAFVHGLHEQIWVAEQRNIIYRDMIQELTNQANFLKKQASDYINYAKGVQQQLISLEVGAVDLKIDNPEDIAKPFLETLRTNTMKFKAKQDEIAQKLHARIHELEGQNVALKDEIQKLNNQMTQQSMQHQFALQQTDSEKHQMQLNHQRVLESETSQLKQQMSQLQLNHQQAMIEEQANRLEERTRLVADHQKERQEIYRQWETEQLAMREKLERRRVETEEFDSENSMLHRTPLSVKNGVNNRTTPKTVEQAIKHYKQKAKDQLQKRISELETVLCYLNDVLMGWNFETQSLRANSLQSVEMFSDRHENNLRRLEQRNPALIHYVNQMKLQIEALYNQNQHFKMRFLEFLNNAVMHTIQQEPQFCESLIHDNHDLQLSLDWLFEKTEIRDDHMILQHSELLWNELLMRCLASRYSAPHNVYESNSGDSPIKSPQHQTGIVENCSVPELSDIMNIQMQVVCNLLSALTTICSHQRTVQSPVSHNSVTPLLGNEWLTSIRPSLDQTTQLAKVLAPSYFRPEHTQHQLDTFVNKALSGLGLLNKRINDLPPDFFTSLTLQHSSLTHCILKFASTIGNIREVQDSNTLLADFNEMLRSQCIDVMQMFTVYLVQVCNYFTSPKFVKDLTTTFIIQLHRREIKSTDTIKKRTNSECKLGSRSHSYRQQTQHQQPDSYQILEELATFLAQLSEHLSL